MRCIPVLDNASQGRKICSCYMAPDVLMASFVIDRTGRALTPETTGRRVGFEKAQGRRHKASLLDGNESPFS